MRRVGLIALLCMTLAACNKAGEDDGALADSRPPPELGLRFLPPPGWAWGFIQIGERPEQRYGVVSGRGSPRALAIILPGYGESGETWFETARDLSEAGVTVWTLDRIAQGGSARYARPHDLGYAPSFDPDVAALKSLVRTVIRPDPDLPLVIVGSGQGALVALRAVETGLHVDGVVLSSPDLSPALPSSRTLAFPAARTPPGWRPWTRSQADDAALGFTHDPWRGAVTHAWQTANPDLRMSEPSDAWKQAAGLAARAAVSAAGDIRAPILLLSNGTDEPASDAVCKPAPHCRRQVFTGAGRDLHLEADAWRKPWLDAVRGFIDDPADYAPPVSPDRNGSKSDGNSMTSDDVRMDAP